MSPRTILPATPARGDLLNEAGKSSVSTALESSPHRPGEVFVGREREIAQLDEALAEAERGRGSISVLVGEAGIGKTRTANELAIHARARHIIVLRGRCFEGERTPPYGPWRTALRALPTSNSVPEAVPLLSAVSADAPVTLPGGEARARLFEAVIGLLRAGGQERPLLMLLDNLQWADPGSLKLLEHLSAEIAETPILVLGTYRDTDLDDRHPLRSALAELTKESGFRRIALSGFSPQEVGLYLARTLAAVPSSELVHEIHFRTDGNPLFLLELVRDMAETQPARLGQLRIPPGVKETIGVRLGRLPDDSLKVLSTASVIGRIFALELLAQALEDVPIDRVRSALERAQSAGFVQEMPDEPGRYRFTHALVQEVLRDRLPAAQRSRWHARIAAAMEFLAGSDIDAWAGAITYHLSEAADPQSLAKFVPLTLKAADHAVANLAPDQAMTLLDRALLVKSRMPYACSDRQTAELLCRRARALDDMARSDEAAESLSQAFDLFAEFGCIDRMVDVALTPVQRAIHAGSSVTWSYADTGLQALRERALAVVPPGSIQQGRLLAHQPSPRDIERALAISRSEKDERLEMTALWHLSYAHLCAGETGRARSEEEAAWAIAGRLGDRWGARFLLYRRCQSSCLVGDLAAVMESAREMLADAERLHSPLSMAAAHQASAIAAHMGGDWDGCREHARACLRLQPGRGETHSHAVVLATLALTECETGDMDAVEGHLRSLGIVTGSAHAPFPFYLPKMAWITGDTRRIDAAAEALGAIAPAGAPFEWVTMGRTFACALIAVLRGDRDEAKRFLDYYRPWKGLRMPWNASGMASDALVALLLETLGRHEEAMCAFEDALAFCRRSGYRPELARTCRDYGEALLRRDAPGDAARADDVLRDGLDAARSLAMVPTVARIEAALEEAGSDGASRRIREHPAGLSFREIEIIRLVTRGLTNAEIGGKLFISPHTVARHVQNTLEKTGMANRTELTAFAFRNGLMAD
ncbi:MAG: AAA family ATPase [Spirochaetes bacterium]|nr:AAA family ATPase [Spirochaetota bacterium]